jgi:lipoyl(octanoyl) transferase
LTFETMKTLDLGKMAYSEAMALQHRLVARAIADADAPPVLLLVEHDPPVITLGRRARREHILADDATLAATGTQTVPVKRGGDVTWHGPGQLVAYPIVRLDRLGLTLRQYVGALEQAVIDTVAQLGLQTDRDETAPGVWTGGQKIAAVGVGVKRWVTYHGLALNVCSDLVAFGQIVPCGLAGRGVTSISRELGRDVEVAEAKPLLAGALMHSLGLEAGEPTAAEQAATRGTA